MKNIGNMMKQAQQMQAKMGELQERLPQLRAEGQSGGGMVTVTMNGKGDLVSLKLDPSIITPDDPELLEDLIKAAFNDAKTKVEEMVASETQSLLGGFGGGLAGLPF